MGRGRNPFEGLNEEQRAAYIANMQQKRKENAANGVVKKLTIGKAVKLHCLDCMGFQRSEIRKCNSSPDSTFPCTLWQWRCKDPHRMESKEGEVETDDGDDEVENENTPSQPDLDKEIQPLSI